MKKRTITLAAAALVAVLVAVPFAYAQHMRGRMHGMGAAGGPGEGGHMMFLGHLAHAKEALGLSDQQVSDIRGILKDLHTQNAASREQLHGGMKAVAAALLANPNDLAGAQALLDKQEATEHAMKVNALNAMSKALNVLTPDQRAKVAQHLEEHGRRFEK